MPTTAESRSTGQKALDQTQVVAFYRDRRVEDQVRRLLERTAGVAPRVAVDMGGGRGFSALASGRVTRRVRCSDEAALPERRLLSISSIHRGSFLPEPSAVCTARPFTGPAP